PGVGRRGVEGCAVPTQGPFDGELGDDLLPRARGGGDQDGLPRLQGLDGPNLEVVQRERIARGEPLEGGHGQTSTPNVSLSPRRPAGVTRNARVPGTGAIHRSSMSRAASWAPTCPAR